MLAISSSFRQHSTRQRRNRKYYKNSCLVIGACCSKLGNLYGRFGCRHITPFILLFAYTLFGAAVLQYAESNNENVRERERLEKMDALRNSTSWKLAEVLSNEIMSDETKQMQTRDLVKWYEKQLGLNHQPVVNWDMWGALFYVGTIYTTIGYGNISPSTTAGRLLTVLYALFGIPLVLAILNDLGQLMRRGINRSWQRLVTYRRSRTPNLASKSPELGLTPGEDDEEGQDPPPIPISVALFLTLGWVLLCSGIFCLWESSWTYGTSLWFFFISVSTIGLGDVVPEKPAYMIANFGFVIVGLCLLSMTLGVIQQRIEQFLYRMMKLIRQEYEAATEQGRTPTSPHGLLANAWEKQAWYVRLMLPHMLSYKAQSRLDKCATRVIRGQTFRTISRDLMLFKNDDLDEQNGRKLPTNGRPSLRSSPPKYSSLYARTEPTFAIPFPQRLLCDVSTQTDRGLALFDLLLLENTEKWSSSSRKSSATQELLIPKRPPMQDVAIQACIRVQTVHMGVQGDTSLWNKNRKRSKSASASAKAKGRKEQETDTQASLLPPRVQRQDQVVQTDDSYLKMAAKLEAYKNNRSDSLAIMVTPAARRPSLPQGDAKEVPTAKHSTSVKV